MSEFEAPFRKLPQFKKPDSGASPKKTFKSLAILATLIVALFGVIYWGMGWIAREDLSASELYARSLDGRADSKRMAALEWGRRLHLYESRGQKENVLRLAPDTAQVKRLSDILKQSVGVRESSEAAPDSAYLGGLATVLGFARFAPAARDGLAEVLFAIRPREWTELQIPLILSLARLQLPISSPLSERLLVVLSEEDPALRKSGVFAVGVLAQSAESRESFRTRVIELVSDAVSDVRWNAGFALARWGDPAAEPILEELVELALRVRRDATLEGDSGEVLTESILLSVQQAFRLIGERPAGALKQKLSVIAREHPHLKLRQAAISALQPR